MVFAKNPGTGCFSYTPGAAEKKCMRKLIILYGIDQCGGNMRLANDGRKILRPVFSG